MNEWEIKALERAIHMLRSEAARVASPEDPYAGLLYADDADLLQKVVDRNKPECTCTGRPVRNLNCPIHGG